MEIIDTLTLADSTNPYFIANTAAASVQLITPGGGNTWHILRNASNQSQFLNGDSFSIISAGIRIPEGFQICQQNTGAPNFLPVAPLRIQESLRLVGVDSGLKFNPDVLSNAGYINIPLDNFELSLDVFCDVPKQRADTPPNAYLNEDFYIQSGALNFNISMLGVPSIFNGKTFYCCPFFKILHNFQMYEPFLPV